MSTAYSKMELMICTAAKELENGKTVAVGTGGPCAAAMLAQRTHAPDLVIAFEAGGLAPILPEMPISVGDSRTFHKAVMAAGMTEMMTACARGFIDYAFLGGAQIDAYGNLNSTCIGDQQAPKVRFPGSGGANDFASFCWQTLIMTVQNAKRFVEKLDFMTSPGYLTGPGAREEAGLPANTGPSRIITDLAVLGFNPKTARMRVESLHPEVTYDDVQAATGFELEKADRIGDTAVPDAKALAILREEVDPHGYIIGR